MILYVHALKSFPFLFLFIKRITQGSNDEAEQGVPQNNNSQEALFLTLLKMA